MRGVGRDDWRFAGRVLVAFAAVAVILLGCAPTRPYATVQVVGPHNEAAWFADGPDMVCWAHNPTPRPYQGELKCTGDRWYPVRLAPGESRPIGFCQVMNREVHAEPCHVYP